jgi:protein ImuB
MYACLCGSGDLVALAREFSPVVEATAPGVVTLHAAGLERLFGPAQDVAAAMARRAAELGLQANLALAANADAAICAARGFAGIGIVPEGDEAKYLGTLPLALLAPSPELGETLARWGIRRFRDLAALPPLGIAERLGAEGLRLRTLARGESDRKLVPIEMPEDFAEELDPEYPIVLLEPLAFLLASLVNGLALRLATRALATDELRLRLALENRAAHERTLRLPVPTLDTRALLKLLQLDLAAHPPEAGIVGIRMEMHPEKPRAAQSGLFVLASPEPVKLEVTLARIRALVGEGHVGSPELLDTHRPGAFRMAEEEPLPDGRGSVPSRDRQGAVLQLKPKPLVLRVFRPPREARVALAAGQPSFVVAEGVRGNVVERSGPWRTSGDWWTNDPWSRDEWDIALGDGGLYRLYCEPRGWFLEGCYD